MAQSEQVWVGTSVFTGTMYQNQDFSVENKGGGVDWAICEELHNKKLSKKTSLVWVQSSKRGGGTNMN